MGGESVDRVAGASSVPASLESELLQMIADQARGAPRRMITSALFVTVILMGYVPVWLPLMWLLSVVLVTTARTLMLVSLPTEPSLTEQQKLTRAAITFAVSAATQVSVLAFFPSVPVMIGSILTIYCVGLASATLPVTAGFRRIYLPYLVIVMSPIAIVWPLAPGFEATLLERFIFVGLTATYMITMLGQAREIYRVFAESYHVRAQRAQLNVQLRDALLNAEDANRAKTRFLAAASHDLRQPIHALALFSGSLQLRKLDHATTAIAAQIGKAVKALAAQLDALLDISKLDAGVIQKTLTDVDLAAMLQQLDDEFSAQAAAKNLQFAVKCPKRIVIRTDAVLFQRVVRNLLSNALKYTDAGRIEVLVQRRRDCCRLVVADTGVGIAPAEQSRIFEEFYQVDNPERDRSKGLGLGLAIVRRLTDLLEIDLHLESAIGQGSRFSLDVPLADADAAAAAAEGPIARIAPPAGINVLVIDDEESIRIGMKTLLEDMGFGVETVASTEEASAAARERPPSVVLADFRLRRDDDGMRAIQAVREICGAIPALLISADSAPDRLRQAHEAGIELLHKPVTANVLRTSILAAVQA